MPARRRRCARSPRPRAPCRVPKPPPVRSGAPRRRHRHRPTTSTLPHPTGWAGFDEMVGYDLLVHGDTSASVAVIIEGDLVHASGFGVRVADTFDLTEPVDRFRIASISKVITAIVTLQLVEAGLLALDEPVGERVASYLGVTPTAAVGADHRRATAQPHVGLRDVLRDVLPGGATSCPDAARQGLTSWPGRRRLSLQQHELLRARPADRSGHRRVVRAAVYERLLTPLGITGMRLASTFDVGPDEVLHSSEPGRTYMEMLGGAGSWVATPTDIVTDRRLARPGWNGMAAVERRDGDPDASRPLQHLGCDRVVRARAVQLPRWLVRPHRHDREHPRDGGQPARSASRGR